MSYTNRQLIESALKRVNALAGTEARLYHDNTGWFIRRFPYGSGLFEESSMSASELLAYLHGIEDTLKYIKEKEL
jgi:hypothetical protein